MTGNNPNQITPKDFEPTENLFNKLGSLQLRNPVTNIEGQVKRPMEDDETPGQPKFQRVSEEKKSPSYGSDSGSTETKATTAPSIISSRDRIIELPQPPPRSQIGRKTKVKVNCFRVHCKCEYIYQYSINCDPPLPDDSVVFLQGSIMLSNDDLLDTFGYYIFDKTKIWALKKLSEPVTISNQDMQMEFKLIKSVKLSDAPYEEFSSIIHVILQRATNQAGLVKIGRSYYEKEMMNEDEFLLKDYNIRLFRGYSMNIEQTMKGLQLTVDLSHRVVSTINASDLIDSFDKNLKPLPPGGMTKGAPVKQHKGEVLRGYHRGVPTMNKAFAANQMFDDRDKENTPEIQRRAEEELVGRSVITTYRLRNWRIDAIEWDKNIDSTFPWKKKSGETVKISFRDYFYTNYRLKLVSKRFGMLVSMPKSRRGKGPDKFYLPPEACYLTGMSKKMKADFRMMKRVRDIVSLTPPKRFEAIENITRDLSKNLETSSSSSSDERSSSSESDEYLKLDIEPKSIEVSGNILEDTYVKLKNQNRHMDVKAADLMRHWHRAHYVNQNPHTIGRWIILHESRYRSQASSLANNLMQTAAPFRMLKTPLDIIEVRANIRGKGVFACWKDEVENILEKIQGLQLIVVVIPNHFRSDEVYSAVKTATLLHHKKLIPTQCIKAQRFDQRGQRSLRSVIASTLKQVLTKRGNIPWIVNFKRIGNFNPFDGKTMLCGIDVNHDMKRNRATAGFCVSGDSRFSRYDTYVSVGVAGKEYIYGAEKCMIKSLMNFHSDNGFLPEHVIVYRDGVSNSQLTAILRTEVQSFKNSFKHYEILKRAKGAYNPKITFVVVQKRVSLRIFNTNLQSGEPGTVVDHTIVSSRFWDFYMLTTKPPNGKTSRPTRYIVVYDDYGISNEELQTFTNQLCHTYYNFPGPIRVPAPCQIAHKVAYLYGSIIAGKNENRLFTPKCKAKAYYL